MSEERKTKTCGMCCQEIAEQAKKCPYCHHWQNKLSMITFHPGVVIIVGFIPMLVLFGLMGKMFDRTFNQAKYAQPYTNQLVVSDYNIKTGNKVRCGEKIPVVLVVGHVKNQSETNWKAVTFEVECLDEKGQILDTTQDKNVLYEVPANKEVAFKICFNRHFPNESYKSYKIRVLSAKEDLKGLF